MPEKLVNVKADTATDFIDAAHKAMKDNKKLGETTYKTAYKASMDSKTKTIKSIDFTLTTQITRVHWAGQAKTKPDAANEKAIKEIEKLNADHEKAHADGYEKAFKKITDKLEKDLVGKTEKEVKDAMKQIDDALTDACEDLHKTGGNITVTDKGNGNITVTESAEGPGGCK